MRGAGRYATFVAALESGSKDNLDFVKERALRAACELLLKKPEAEAALLTLLVNKLGDPSRKLASKVRAWTVSEAPSTTPAADRCSDAKRQMISIQSFSIACPF